MLLPVGGELAIPTLSFGFVELSQLFMQVPDGGVVRLRGHLPALLGAPEMERAVTVPAHRPVPTLRGH